MPMHPRIVSLLPSATEIAVAAGQGPNLVGRSHECDFPPFVSSLPICTATRLETGLTSRQIDNRVQEIVRQGLSVYEVNAPLLRALRPDIILTQTQCAVCAVTPTDLEEALDHWVGVSPVLISFAPERLDDVWNDLRRFGIAVDASTVAEQAIEQLQNELSKIEHRAAPRWCRPTVAAIEWVEPLMAAGNWVPELIRIAGGEPLFAAVGQHSPWLDWEVMADADPDVIVIMPCGYKIEQTFAEIASLTGHSEWSQLKAVREGQVFLADGHHFFNRPGPRLVESARIIAELLDEPDADHGNGWLRIAAVAR